MARTDENFAAWGDFRAWMDMAYARAVRSGTDAVHAADPHALAALEGGQVPGWGGYDYTRLSQSVDAMEIYDAGGNIDIVRSLAPHVVLLTTSFLSGPKEEHRIWRETLRGVRGLVLWDAKRAFVGEDGKLGERGRAAASYFRELRAGIAAQIFSSDPMRDPVAILYSPASMRIQWMLDWKDQGDAWSRRNSELEGQPNTYRSAFTGYLRALAASGFTPHVVSSGMIASGALERQGDRVLVLPDAVALSPETAAAVGGFAARGGTVIADRQSGAFDEHGRKRRAPLVSRTTVIPPEAVREFQASLAAAQVVPAFPVGTSDARRVSDVETYRYRNGGITLLALQHMSAPGDSATTAETITVKLPRRAYVYDLRQKSALGLKDRITLALDPVDPTIVALSPRELAAPVVKAPARIRAGADGTIRLVPGGAADGALHVIHVEVMDPAGNPVAPYSGNILARRGGVSRLLPFALNDPPGTWHIRATDMLSGETTTAAIEVSER
jgi:hypothetical protein